MTELYIDIETYCATELKTAGVYRYASCPSFMILMAAWSIDGETVHVAIGEDEVRRIPGLWDDNVTKIAHNAQFERVCFSTLAGLPTGTYLDPEPWRDTQAIAGELGYPQTLDGLARALGAEEKDSAGTRLINLFSKPNRSRRRNTAADKPDDWAAFVDYCRQDVVTLIDVDRRMGSAWPTDTEHQVWLADQRINDRGLRIDCEMAARAVSAADDNRMVQELEISAITGVTNPGSNIQLLAWLQDSGLKIRNLQAKTVEKALASGKLNDDQRRVLELRQELALVASKKYTAALNAVCDDGRLRGSFRFFGAHTGRWAGRGVQLQNLPRAAFMKTNPDTGKSEWDGVAENAAIVDLSMGAGAASEDLKKLVRALFVGPFVVVDYAAIEARVIAWLAGEQWALDAFAAGRDIYVETAERMGGLTRAQGKIAVLALGYAGGINSLIAMGGQGTDEELQTLVYQWRQANPRIVQLWKTMESAMRSGGQVGPHLKITREGSTAKMHLPSGRAIHYHGVRWENYTVTDPVTGRLVEKEGWRYDDPKRPGFRIGTYGGRLVENATQAVARDILAEALVRLQSYGYTVVAHVHDEVLVESTDDWRKISDVMCIPPSWADGLPIDGDGFECLRYRKG